MRYAVRGLPAADAEKDVVGLWAARGVAKHDQLFRWGYLDSPIEAGHCFVLDALEAGGPTPVGTVGLGTRRVQIGGRQLRAAVLGDFFVLKAHRTFFPALMMQRAAVAWARQNFDLVYGFPNESARPVIERIGFRGAARMDRWVLPLRHVRYLSQHVGSRTGSHLTARGLALALDTFRRYVHPRIARGPRRGFAFTRFTKLDARFDALFQGRAMKDVPVGARDAKLLQWRFVERPDHPCSIWGLVGPSGALKAYVALDIRDGQGHVRDLLGEDIDAMAEALRLAAGVADGSRCASLSFVCAAPALVTERLAAIGFRLRDEGEGARTLYTKAGEATMDPQILSDIDHRWYVTEADEDQ